MKTELKYLHIPFETKAGAKDDEVIIEGYGAVKGNIDSYGDVLAEGSMSKSIGERGERIAFCLQHDIYNPVGKILEISEDEKGLKIKARISDAHPEVKTKIKEGILREMSIGYTTINSKQETIDGKEVRILTEVKLYEVSLVTVAANELAVIEDIKSEEGQNKLLAEFDNVITREKDNGKKYELMRLRSLVKSSLPQIDAQDTSEPPAESDKITIEEVLTILAL